MRGSETLEREVAAIGTLPREELVALWTKAHGHPPPVGMKRGLLEHAAAWHMQAKVLGGLSPLARNAMQAAKRAHAKQQRRPEGAVAGVGRVQWSAVGGEANLRVQARAGLATLQPGTRLMREWNGHLHAVDVTGEGFVFDGKTYRSLTAVAKRITGVQWSGPRFFGL